MSSATERKIAIVGSGALGGFLGFKFVQAGFSVTFLDRPERSRAIREKGLTLVQRDGTSDTLGPLKATDSFHEVGACDLVILSVKAHQIGSVASSVSKLFHADTEVITVQNGLSWWYFQKHGGPHLGKRIMSLDPDGHIHTSIHPDRVIGCVAYPAVRVLEPGVIEHVEGDRFPVGELDGEMSDRCRAIEHAFTTAGLRSRVLPDIRSEIWLKAWGSLSFNPISALTRATLQDICRFRDTRALAETMMLEAQTVAQKLGVTFRHPIERRIQGAEAVGHHKTSMLQDIESGQELEIEALVGSVVELASLTNTPVPTIEAIYACTRLLNLTVCKSS